MSKMITLSQLMERGALVTSAIYENIFVESCKCCQGDFHLLGSKLKNQESILINVNNVKSK